MGYVQVKPIEIQDLKLSECAMNFVEEYAPKLTKPYSIGMLPNDYPNYGCMSDSPDRFLIGVQCNVSQSDLEANFCHELFHAYQFSVGFPTVIGYENDTSTFCEHLRSTVLDLSDNEALRAYGLTYQNVIRVRHRQCKRLCATCFKEINNPFLEALLIVDLILDLSDFTSIQSENVLQSLKQNLPNAYDRYNEYHHVIFKQYNFRTKEGCLNIFARFFDDFKLWGDCSILYAGNDIRARQKFEKLAGATNLE